MDLNLWQSTNLHWAGSWSVAAAAAAAAPSVAPISHRSLNWLAALPPCLQLDSTQRPELRMQLRVYFDRMEGLRQNTKLESRIRFMIQDVLELRANNWIPRSKKEGPKKIEVRWHILGGCFFQEPPDVKQPLQGLSHEKGLEGTDDLNLECTRVLPAAFNAESSSCCLILQHLLIHWFNGLASGASVPCVAMTQSNRLVKIRTSLTYHD